MKPLIIAVCGATASGKAQPNDTLIPTPNGLMPLGDIKIGDIVFSREGKPEKVLGVFPQGQQDVYQITFSDGRKTYAAKDHIFTCVTSRDNFINKTVEDLYLQYQAINLKNGKVKIPINEPVEYPEQLLPIHPYIVGAFLGDGCCVKKYLTISSGDVEIPNHIAELLPYEVVAKLRTPHQSYDYVFEYKHPEQYKNKYITTLKIFEQYSKELCTKSFNKKIPDNYIYSSIEQRYALLQGLLDTDGSVTKQGCVSFCSTSKQLINDVQQICWSLGFLTHISIDSRANKYTTHYCYTLTIKTQLENKLKLFFLPRKKEILNNFKAHQHKYYVYKYLYIDKVEKKPLKKNMTCIYVDNKEHLYLTNDYIVTHNTTLLHKLAPAIGATKIVSDATRPPRSGEQNGVDYNFITTDEFTKGITEGRYLEYTVFRHWLYGTPRDAVCGKVNIGVFNVNGIVRLLNAQDDYDVYPILLKTNPIVRLERYISRDGHPSFECLRRFWTDFEQFTGVENILDVCAPQHLVLKNFKIDQNLNDLVQYLVGNPLSAYYQ